MSDQTQIDTEVELYLALESTGIADWRSFTPLASETVFIRRGQDDLADDPTPGQSEMHIRDSAGNLVPENPMGLYYGSIDRGTPQRVSIRRGVDTFTRSSASGWGGLWTNGLSSGGTVAATDWTVSSNSARHSVPVANARRTSDYDLLDQVQADGEVRVTVTFPVGSPTVASISTELWFRADSGGLTAAQLIVQPGGALNLGFYDIVDGATSVRLSPTATGLSAAANQTWKFAAQVEGMTVRSKVWAATDPEPLGWTVSANGVAVRPGWVSISSFVTTGNTNAKPLVFIYDDFKIRLPLFSGELTDIRPSGDDRSGGLKKVKLQAQDVLNRFLAPGAPEESSMRRARSRDRRWWYINVDNSTATGGSTSTATFATATFSGPAVGDLMFLTALGLRKEDTPLRITGLSSGGGTTTVTFTPQARNAVASGDVAFIVRESPPSGTPTGYWPMEEGNQAGQFESGLPNGLPGDIVLGAPDFASNQDFACSLPIPTLNDSDIRFPVPVYSSTVHTIVFLLSMPETDDAAVGQNIVDVVIADGTARTISLAYNAAGSGSFQLLATDSSGAAIYTGGTADFLLRGNAQQVTWRLEQTGGQVYSYLSTAREPSGLSATGPSALTGVTTLGRVETIRVNPGGGYDNVAVGHVTFAPYSWDIYTTYFDLYGWGSRAAMYRLLRIGYEEGIPVSYQDSGDVVTTALGRQKTMSIFKLLTQITELDGGFLTGPKGELGLNLRTRGSIYNRDPAFTLHGGSGGHIGDPFDPAFDFAETVNRVTVDRIDGATVVREETTGRLSTSPPPSGVGRRERSFIISAGSDSVAGLLADERLNTGVIRGPRIKELNLSPMARNSITVEQMADLSIGDRVDGDTLNTRNVYGTLSAIVIGYELQLRERFSPELKLNCTRGEPYRAFALTGDDRARPDGFDTVMTSTVNTTTLAGLTMDSQSGNYRWTTRASDFPILLDIAGEHVLVSSITGAGTAQTLVVSQRSVNGVVKGHVPGHTVRLAYPNRAARR